MTVIGHQQREPQMYKFTLTLAALITAASVVSSPALAGSNITIAGVVRVTPPLHQTLTTSKFQSVEHVSVSHPARVNGAGQTVTDHYNRVTHKYE
jgi:hypothetical protein